MWGAPTSVKRRANAPTYYNNFANREKRCKYVRIQKRFFHLFSQGDTVFKSRCCLKLSTWPVPNSNTNFSCAHMIIFFLRRLRCDKCCCLKVLKPSFFVFSSMYIGFVYNILCQVWKAKPALFQWHGSRLNTSEAETESAEGVFRPVHRYLLFLACPSFMSRTSRLRIPGAQTFDLHMFNLILKRG